MNAARRVVVIGNGMVGYRFCEALVEGGAGISLTVLGEERHPAYDRVHLTDSFSGKTASDLLLATAGWYEEKGIALRTGERALAIDREKKFLRTSKEGEIPYDTLVLATGSVPFVPPTPGKDLPGVFVYRTLDDVEAIRSWAKKSRRAVVIGGGLLGLEAAKAVHDLGLETRILEFAPRLMPRQLDDKGAALLARKIAALGISVHLQTSAAAFVGEGAVSQVKLASGDSLDTDMVIISAGIRPRDDLAKACGLSVGERGGIQVDDQLRTSDPSIYAIGECALHKGMVYGLVAPGYDMAKTAAASIRGENAAFTGADLSTQLKLLGVDVASFGDAFNEAAKSPNVASFEDVRAGIYKKLVLSADGTKLLGGILVGDASDYRTLLGLYKSAQALPERIEGLLLGSSAGAPAMGPSTLPDEAQVCSCNNVSKGAICLAIRREEATTLGKLKSCTKAGTGCGGCIPLVTNLLNAELKAAGKSVNTNLCEHFPYTRQQLFEIVKIKKIKTFDELVRNHGRGDGCEICKPAVASILAATWNEMILKHDTIQDTNDRYLANIQRGGTYSVIPRVPGGEITPEKLIVLGQVAKKYDLYCKITGGQRIDLLGARVEQLPDIWKDLVAAGFESGHAYGKALRTVKSCVGTTWCRYGVQDSTAMAIRLENRYRGLRAPHKIKSAVSGCVRECAEAQGKDFGVIATEKGWNLYVCGNGGAKPRHADLLAADLDDETLIRYIDRFLMYYIRTADRLTRTSVWIETLEKGIETIRDVVIRDSLGICTALEAEMQHLVATYKCEWAEVVNDPEKQELFRHFVNDKGGDPTVRFERERGQKYPDPSSWEEVPSSSEPAPKEKPGAWVRVAAASDVPANGGIAFKYGDAQIAIYNLASQGRWYATQNLCPHRNQMALARGIVGDAGGVPKVACPFHKKTFSLESGECLSGEQYAIQTFPVKVAGGEVFAHLPPAAELAAPEHACAREKVA
ncbi:MAG: nitrite reductase large subunit NirB [Bdellovibrionota bacterium]